MSHEHPSSSCCSDESCCAKAKLGLYAAVALGTLLLGAGLVALMVHYTKPAPLTEDRNKVRKQNLVELRAANAEALTTYAWVDQGRGVVRLPVAQAVALTIQQGKDPVAARADLLARLEKATAPLPKAPEKPSALE